jgi:hypothetical protein
MSSGILLAFGAAVCCGAAYLSFQLVCEYMVWRTENRHVETQKAQTAPTDPDDTDP